MTIGSSNGPGFSGKGSSVLRRGLTAGASSGSRRSGRGVRRGGPGSVLTGPGSVLTGGVRVGVGAVGASTVAVTTLGRPVPNAGSLPGRIFPAAIRPLFQIACCSRVTTVESAKAF